MREALKIIKTRTKEEKLSNNHNETWRDWKWQVKNTIKNVDDVEKILEIRLDEKKKKQIEQTLEKFPMAVTPYYLSLIDFDNYEKDPIFKQAFPDIRELSISKCDMEDPLNEDKDSPVEGVTHRYPDRVLLHVSNVCAMYCRHCTRKRKVGDISSIPSKSEILKGIDYIRNNKNIRDVLLSGGDPFMLSDEYLEWILDEVSKIKHVEVIRIGTRTPVVLPYRITDKLVNVLKKYDNIWINTHFNHPREITKDSRIALKKLSSIGIPLGNQTVLLADVNDCPGIMKKLVHELVKNKVRPYYLYQCDLSEGLEHFRTNIGIGIEIIESLRGHTSGFAIPTYVIDAPGGGGKIPVMPNYLISWSTNKVVLRNYEGLITTYKFPDNYEHTSCDLKCDKCDLTLDLEKHKKEHTDGVASLLSDHDSSFTIVPKNLDREERNRC
ncbi:L-lysine 2,3-aminomutase KamA [Gottschalkia purinilytica]|uniref:L-lysine 2,3-aminomutase n=1 Tax=Gottschalkia purinilytica TaxID=1503 RepID=A0A0L0WAT1_GOTPU|nr:lysine 2,3-aminomutase [Gottschalkia purinilytica]KNF08603.1 L-lysine 2,3-aminomutase KamA [Gottschalkia purinilytica]